ncbi:MAG TPA: anti-sigma regulatory factor [Minicystis sp.]|nr:anti-sigma regulatory factor [Minicystis sp.]
MPDVVSRIQMPIESEDDVAVVRRRVRDVAVEIKLDSFAIAGVTTAASELTRNVWVHAGRGGALIEVLEDGYRKGVRLTFKDEGPGIADLGRALAGGFSTSRSMGLGLSGSRRLVDEFDIRTVPGKGTTVTVVKWKPY